MLAPPPLRALVCGSALCEALVKPLREQGVAVEEVATTHAAFVSIRARQFHAVFIDIDHLELNGFEIAKRVRRVVIYPRVRLIAVTEFNRTSDLATSRTVGFDLRVMKPIQLDQIFAALHTIRS